MIAATLVVPASAQAVTLREVRHSVRAYLHADARSGASTGYAIDRCGAGRRHGWCTVREYGLSLGFDVGPERDSTLYDTIVVRPDAGRLVARSSTTTGVYGST